MKLKCYALQSNPLPLVPAPSNRAWMDNAVGGHPYRCLPLAIANNYGWQLLSPADFSVYWNGGDKTDDLVIQAEGGFPYIDLYVSSHFRNGIVTFDTTYLFRTELGWDLVVTGPLNSVKDGIAPLTGVIETEWLPYPFTMNWRMTRAGMVKFAKDEPICQLFPVPRGALEEIQPEIFNIEDDAELNEQAQAWRKKRSVFAERLGAGDPEAVKQAWQCDYFVGRLPDGREFKDHVNKLRLNSPIDRRSQKK